MSLLSRSNWRKVVVLILAIVGFVLAYETRMLDSTGLRWIIGDGASPPPGSQLQFNATAYCKGTTTASGVGVRTGIAAADASLLPVGSVLNVATGDERYNGVYTVMDTGPKVQGRLLDLYMWSCHEALRFGRKDVQVTVLRLGWDPRASAPTIIDRIFRGRASRRPPPEDPPPPAGIPPADGSDEDHTETPPDDAPAATPSESPAPASSPAPEATTP